MKVIPGSWGSQFWNTKPFFKKINLNAALHSCFPYNFEFDDFSAAEMMFRCWILQECPVTSHVMEVCRTETTRWFSRRAHDTSFVIESFVLKVIIPEAEVALCSCSEWRIRPHLFNIMSSDSNTHNNIVIFIRQIGSNDNFIHVWKMCPSKKPPWVSSNQSVAKASV